MRPRWKRLRPTRRAVSARIEIDIVINDVVSSRPIAGKQRTGIVIDDVVGEEK